MSASGAGAPEPMEALFRLAPGPGDAAGVEAWFDADEPLRLLVRPWFARLRGAGPGVRVLIHDARPTVCLGDAAFAYVAAFRAHAAVGFFHGAALADPAGLLEGEGRRMRHVKLRFGAPVDEAALAGLVAAAYADMRRRLDAG